MKTFLLAFLLLPPLFPESEAGRHEVLSGGSPLIQRPPTSRWASPAFALSWLAIKQRRRTAQFGSSLRLSLNCLLPSAGQIKLKSSHWCFQVSKWAWLFLSTAFRGIFRGCPEAASADGPSRQVCRPGSKLRLSGQDGRPLISIQNKEVNFHFTGLVKPGTPQTVIPKRIFPPILSKAACFSPAPPPRTQSPTNLPDIPSSALTTCSRLVLSWRSSTEVFFCKQFHLEKLQE